MSSKLANTGAISMKDKKKSSLKIDKNGNVDTNNLSTEIKDSLDFDLRYKQTDNMKKRAIRVAGCYDDFKNMVACAHLKTVSRKEVESLREVKKGTKFYAVHYIMFRSFVRPFVLFVFTH